MAVTYLGDDFTFSSAASPDMRISRAPCRQGGSRPNCIKTLCNQIRSQIEETTSEYDRKKLQQRLQNLPALSH